MVEYRDYRSLGVLGGAMSASAHEALVRLAIEVIWNRGDLDAADELFAPGRVNRYGLNADLVLGPEAIKVSAALYRLAFPGLHVSVEEISTIEDTVVLRWTARTAADQVGSDAVASKPKSLTGITRSRIAAGKIVESWTEWDRMGVLRELGVPTE
jgi:hypothetical protein